MAKIIVCVFAVVTIYIIVCLQCNGTDLERQYRAFETLRTKQHEIPEDEKAAAWAVASRMADVYQETQTLQANLVIQDEGYYTGERKYSTTRVLIALQMAPEKLRVDVTYGRTRLYVWTLCDGWWREYHPGREDDEAVRVVRVQDDPNGVSDFLTREGYAAFDCVLGQYMETWIGPKSTKARRSFLSCLSKEEYLGRVRIGENRESCRLFRFQQRDDRADWFYLTDQSYLYRWTTIYFEDGNPVFLQTRTFENLRINEPVSRPWSYEKGGENTSTSQ